PPWPKGLYAWVTVAASIAAGGLAMANWDDITDGKAGTLLDGALAFDTFAMFVTIAICAALIGVALIMSDHLRRVGLDRPEHYALFVIIAASGAAADMANVMMVLFRGVATLSISLYIRAEGKRRPTKGHESEMKNFI